VHGAAGSADQITVHIAVHAHAIHGEVSDSGPGFTPAVAPKPREIEGFGLVIIDRSSTQWGTSHGGRHVWFELDRVSDDAVVRTPTSLSPG
jgi:hypothetical protein